MRYASVALDDVKNLLVRRRRAELDAFEVFLDHACVARWQIVEVASAEDFASGLAPVASPLEFLANSLRNDSVIIG